MTEARGYRRLAGAGDGDGAADGIGPLAAFVLSLALSLTCAAVSALAVNDIGRIFAAGFLLATGYVAARVRLGDLIWALIIPPLSFAFALWGGGLLISGSGGGFLTQQVLDTATRLATKAPYLLSGEGLALLVVLVRAALSRRNQV